MHIQAFISCLPLLGGGRESQPFWGWWGAAGEVLTEVGEYEEATGKSKQCSLPRAWWLGSVGEKTAKEGQGQYLWISVGKATAMFMKNLTNLIFTFQVRELGADRLRTPRATRIDSKSMDPGQSASIPELQPHCHSVRAFRTSPSFLPQDLCTYCLHRLEDTASLSYSIYLLFRLWCHFLKFLSPQPSPIPYFTSSKPQSPYDSTPHSCNFLFICVIIWLMCLLTRQWALGGWDPTSSQHSAWPTKCI